MHERGDAPVASAREAAPSRRLPAVGVELLVILDGASEPPRPGLPTSLERAATPALDALCAEGALTRLRTVAPWLEAGSEHAIPALLGWTPPAPVDRGAVEAAARGIAVREGERAWRIDVRRAADGTRAAAADALPSLAVALPSHTLHLLGGHRLLAVGRAPLPWPASLSDEGSSGAMLPSALPADAMLPSALPAGAMLPSAVPAGPHGLTLHRWPEGVVPPRLLDDRTVMIAAPGAAAGIARLMGARVVTPAGATGRAGSDLAAKAAAALAAVAAGAARVVVHVGAPDEAAHELDASAKIAAIETADRDLITPLAAALRARADAEGSPRERANSRTVDILRICPDHGCDPRDGRHDPAPVPCVTWSTQIAPRSATDAPRSATDALRSATDAPRLTERAVAWLPLIELAERERAAA